MIVYAARHIGWDITGNNRAFAPINQTFLFRFLDSYPDLIPILNIAQEVQFGCDIDRFRRAGLFDCFDSGNGFH